MPSGQRSPAFSRFRDAAPWLAAFAGSLLVFGVLQQVCPPRLDAQQLSSGLAGQEVRTIAGRYAFMATAQPMTSAFMTTAQPLSEEQMEMGLLEVDRLSATWAGRRAALVPGSSNAGPRPGTEVMPRDRSAGSDAADAGLRLTQHLLPLAPSTFGLAVRMVAEPAVAVGDSTMWVTGNWFAARSTDAGSTWTYVNPYADFPTFASDQDAVYDPQRRAFLWYRQGGPLPGRFENSVKLSVSTDGAASWCGFTLRPSEIDPSWNTLNFDYPHLALTDNYLYLSSMLAVTGAGFASPRMVLLRMRLDDLTSCAAFRFVYWTSDEGWSWTPVENGATTAMYLGDTLDSGGAERSGTFRVYIQPESSLALSYVDRSVPAWTHTERTGLCTVLGGGNPCARSDHRVTSGWVRQRPTGGEVGFLWNVAEGGGFPQPYINAVTFDQDSLSVTGRPMLWDSKCAWQYGAVAANGPDLGIAAFQFCASQPPAHAVGVADGTDGPPHWAMTHSRVGQTSTSTLVWGDYIRVRAAPGGFLATGYTIGASGAEPFLVSFSRRPAGGDDEPPQLPGDNRR